jgi:hypothetical protein
MNGKERDKEAGAVSQSRVASEWDCQERKRQERLPTPEAVAKARETWNANKFSSNPQVMLDAFALALDAYAQERGGGCGCKTAEQTGTINGYSCVWHRDKWHVAIDAVRRQTGQATSEAAAQIADEIGRRYAEKDDSGSAVPTDETCAAVACAVTIAAEIRARALREGK